MHALRIVGLTLFAAVVFRVLHDPITARVCIEYFTIGHPPIGWHKAGSDPSWVQMVPEAVPPAHRVAFVADVFAHGASYFAGFVGGVALWCYALVTRWRRRTRGHA